MENLKEKVRLLENRFPEESEEEVIPPHMVEKIYRRFGRGSNTTSDNCYTQKEAKGINTYL